MPATTAIKLADEIWIALALLHREHPERQDFTADQIKRRMRQEGLYPSLRAGVSAHLSGHMVAATEPSTGRYAMVHRVDRNRVRLYRPGDQRHPERTGKTHPLPQDVPEHYRALIHWYQNEFCAAADVYADDPILRLRGLGKHIWKGIDPLKYVQELRRGWE